MKNKCHDCGIEEGHFHQPGCDMERCPFCGGQLIGCGCRYKKLGYKYLGLASNHPTSGLPEEIYKNGLSDEEEEKFQKMVDKEGRVPYILFPVLCCYCGKLWPKFFRVSDKMWKKYVPVDFRGEVICYDCFMHIKNLVDTAAMDRGDEVDFTNFAGLSLK